MVPAAIVVVGHPWVGPVGVEPTTRPHEGAGGDRPLRRRPSPMLLMRQSGLLVATNRGPARRPGRPASSLKLRRGGADSQAFSVPEIRVACLRLMDKMADAVGRWLRSRTEVGSERRETAPALDSPCRGMSPFGSAAGLDMSALDEGNEVPVPMGRAGTSFSPRPARFRPPICHNDAGWPSGRPEPRSARPFSGTRGRPRPVGTSNVTTRRPEPWSAGDGSWSRTSLQDRGGSLHARDR